MNHKFGLIFSIGIIFIFFVLSLFFLQADPDNLLSLYSRDAFTDEGLNTVQIANWYKFGKLDYYSCDNFVKNPLYNCWIYLSYFFSNTFNTAGRFFVLITLVFMLLYVLRSLKNHQLFVGIAVFVGLFNVYLFQYAHFTMPEIVASIFIFCFVLNFSLYLEQKQIKNLVYTIVFTYLSFLFKFQFVYVFLLLGMLFFFNHKKLNKKAWIYIVGLTGFLGLSYLLIWYSPHFYFFQLIYKDQINGGFLNPSNQYLFIYEQLKNYFFSKPNLALTIGFFVSIPLFFINLRRIKNDVFLKSMSIGLACWLVLESHKLFIAYLPPRYLISTFLAISLFSSFQFYLSIYYLKKIRTYVIFPLLFFILINNYLTIDYLFSNRSYQIKKLNEKFQKMKSNNRPMLGQWANTIAINSSFNIIPFTYNSFDDEHFLKKINPQILVLEKNEKDVYYLKHVNYFREQTIKTDSVQLGTYHLLIHYLK